MVASGSVRFLHTSDWQLGMTRHFLKGEAQSRYTGARLDVIREIGRVARERRCDFVVVAGDVFDSNLMSAQTVRRALDALSAVDVPVYLLPGNHDACNAATIYRQPLFVDEVPAHVHVLDTAGCVPIAGGVELVAAPLTSNAPLDDPTAAVLGTLTTDGPRRVLVAHGQVDAIAPAPERSAIRLDNLEAALADGRIHYVALGDRHSRLDLGTTGRVHYSGSPEVTAFRDKAAGDVLVVELDGDGAVSVEPVQVGRWRFLDIAHEIGCADDIATLDAELAKLTEADRTVVRHALRGTLSLVDHAALQEVLDRHTDRLAGCFPWERFSDIVVYAQDGELSDLGISGYVAEAAAELSKTAADNPCAGDALALLYRLARTGTR